MKTIAFAAALIAATNATEWGYRAPQVSYRPVTKVVQKPASEDRASAAYGRQYEQTNHSDWDAWGRDQDLSVDESYGNTTAKSYRAESYDEWDNKDNDKWGAQQWGQDRDMYGASSSEYDASRNDYDAYGAQGKNYGGYQTGGAYGGYGNAGQGYGKAKAGAASWKGQQARAGADNDVWAKQASGMDTDSRWGKSYDSVEARNYDNEHYAREVRADDDQWAEDYDRYNRGQKDAYAKGASKELHNAGGYGGWGGYGKGGKDQKAASAAYGQDYMGKSASDWDAWGRDQDLHEKVSYDQTRAKAYSAESYDEWDNQDADKWGAQAWGKDRDVYGASSYGAKASDIQKKGYGAGAYGASKHGQHGSYGGKVSYGGKQSSGWGKNAGYGKTGYYGGSYGAQEQASKAGYGQGSSVWAGASQGSGAAKAGYDNDEWAKQAAGSDFDSRWGKSYDRVSAKSYDNEKYARWLQADDDQWAEDYDRYDSGDKDSYGRAASNW